MVLHKANRMLWLLVSMAALTFISLLGLGADPTAQTQRTQMVKDLQLTDFALFTEARYTRHLSQADHHSAFQDHPHALEHFPSGSLVLPREVTKP